MKKIILCFIALLLLCPIGVVAGEMDLVTNTVFQVQTVKAGILPNSFWYWADIFAEEVQYVVKFDRDKKIFFLDQLASERLQEKQELEKKGIDKYDKSLEKRYDQYLKMSKKLRAKTGASNIFIKIKNFFRSQ